MESIDRGSLLAQLAEMPVLLQQAFAALTAQDATWRGSGDTFAPVEQCWHLADGARVAEEGHYLRRSLEEGLEAFRVARLETLAHDAEHRREIEDWVRRRTERGSR